MEQLRAHVHIVEGRVYDVSQDVAVLQSRFDAMMVVIAKMGTSLDSINNIMQQQSGAMKFVRFGWAAIGALLTLASVYIAYLALSRQ